MTTVIGYLILSWIFLRVVVLIWDRIGPSKEIVVMPFMVSGKNVNIDGAIPAKIFGTKLQDLKQFGAQPISGYGLIQTPLFQVPEEALATSKEISKKVEELNIKVKDVDIGALIKTLRALIGTNKVELQGQIAELNDTFVIYCQLAKNGRQIVAWRSSRKREEPFSVEEVIDGLVDDVLFQFIFDISANPALSVWRRSKSSNIFPNWKTFQAFTRGRLSLLAYQQDLDYRSLKDARKHLSSIQKVAPNFPLGLYLYGVVLAEDRDEAEAEGVFRQVQVIHGVDDRIRLNAKLQQAGSLLRLYSRESAQKAADLLQQLINEVEPKVDMKGIRSSANTYYKMLLTMIHAQLGYTYGTMIAICRKPEYYEQAKLHLATALEKMQDGNWDNDREKKDAEFRIKNAEGYSLFRYAQWKTKEFVKDCERAIRLLNEANELRPNHYEVLQNLAMIYDNEDFDPPGIYLDSAEALYEKTKAFVPNDYYQYERLARIQWRRMQKAPLTWQKKTFVDKGVEYATCTLKIRPRSGDSLLLLAVFQGEMWKMAKGDDKSKPDLVRPIITSLNEALTMSEKKENLPLLREALSLIDLITKDSSTSGGDAADLGKCQKGIELQIHNLEEQSKGILFSEKF